ncbi:MAG: lysophospholipase [Oscillibacter sp.]|nr:lysophospholipase [Oscillibacter sp.]
MVFHEFTYLSANGKTPIHAVEWLPEKEPIAVLQLAHGVSEHILRYEPLAAYLTERGFAVVGHDHLGHGASVIEGKGRLYFGPKGSWNTVVQDIEVRRQLAREKFPSVPYFLLGHSMGSFLARTYLIRHHGTVNAAIIMGTGQMPPALVKSGIFMANLESRRVGEDQPSPLIDKIAFGPYNKPFAPNRTPYDWLSVNESNVDDYIAHPLCGGIPSTGLFREMLTGISFITNQRNVEQMDKSTPILFISGEMDPVGDLSKGVKRAYGSFRAAGMKDVQLKLYPGLRHEILNEDCREQVFEDLYNWMATKTAAAL